MLAGVAGMLTIAILLIIQDGRVRVEPLMNGVLAGLVSITACANVVDQPRRNHYRSNGCCCRDISCSAIRKNGRLMMRLMELRFMVVPVPGGTLCVALFGQLDLIGTGLNTSPCNS